MPLPTLRVLQKRGGSASIQEIVEGLATLLDLPESVLEIPHGQGPHSEFSYQTAWARTYLKKMGAADNSTRGIWSVTEYGRELLSREDAGDLIRQHVQEYRRSLTRSRATRTVERDSSTPREDLDGEGANGWQEGLLSVLKTMAPDAFERLCQRILRESEFTEVEVTGRSGDGGIDGVGVLRVNLISFHVVFQCKRYEGSVGAGQIRDFRGAMIGRADKGLFLTTGRFSSSAKQEATRAGAPAIDLIDGSDLCDLLKKLDLGVRTEKVEIEEVSVVPEFFDSI